MAFTNEDVCLFQDNYFKIIKMAHDYFEIQSRNTKHMWIIQDYNCIDKKTPFIIYHKRKVTIESYHKHETANSVSEVLEKIKKHDIYVMENKDVIKYSNLVWHKKKRKWYL